MSDMRDVDATPVAWREAGAGPLVVFLHGLGMTRTGFDLQLAALAPDYRCVAWDMPGYGASPMPAGGPSLPPLPPPGAPLLPTPRETRARPARPSLGGP